MANKNVVSHGDQNEIRRAAKQRQQAARHAAAHTERIKRDNYRVGFQFARNDGLAETLERQRIENEMEKALSFGRQVNSVINQWLDNVDADGTFFVPRQILSGVELFAMQELTYWIGVGAGGAKYGYRAAPGKGVYIALAKRVEAAKAA